jgi:Fe-S-cluster-containing hydrogenase component 2
VSPPEQTEGGIYTPDYNQPILLTRLDPVPEAGSLSMIAAGEGTHLEMELVTEKAIVCDLCSGRASQKPACVAQCPHDAAMRVNARFEFPLG